MDEFNYIDTENVRLYCYNQEDLILFIGYIIKDGMQTANHALCKFRKALLQHIISERNENTVIIDGVTRTQAYDKMMLASLVKVAPSDCISEIDENTSRLNINDDLPEWYNELFNEESIIACNQMSNDDEGVYEAHLETKDKFIYFYIWQ